MTTNAESTPDAASADVVERPARGRRVHLSDTGRAIVPLVVAIVVLSIVASSRSDHFFTTANAQNLLDQIAVLGVLAVGTTFLMIAGQLDLSVGSGATVVTIVTAKLIENGHNLWLAMLVGVACGIVIGLVIGTVVAVTRVAPFILTLGALSMLTSVALIISKQQPIPIGLNLSDLAVERYLGVPAPFWVFVACLVVGSLVLRFTRLGRNAYAVGANEEAAFVSGIPVGVVKVALYGVNGLAVGIAGLLLTARLGSGDPTAGQGLELQAIAAVVLGGATLAGGRGSMLGTFLGVFLLGLISNSLTITGVQSFYQQLVLGGVLVIAVVSTALLERHRASGRPLRLRRVTRRKD
jgi:ribose/xylose/arabinose/galactoside ABC-type transport system permease subunit